MVDVATGIKDLLITSGVGDVTPTNDWGVHVGRMPDKPANAIQVTETGGQPANPKWLIDFPSAQVRVRGENYSTTKTKIDAVKNALLGLPSQDVNGDRWDHVNAIGDVAFIGFNENQQAEFVMNFGLIIEPASGTNRSPL